MSFADPEEELREMIDGLNLPEPSPDEASVHLLNEAELLTRYNAVTRELMQRGEILHPKTAEARDLHSLRGALVVELKRRNVLP